MALLQLSAVCLSMALAAAVVAHLLGPAHEVWRSECISDMIMKVLAEHLALLGLMALVTTELALLNLLDVLVGLRHDRLIVQSLRAVDEALDDGLRGYAVSVKHLGDVAVRWGTLQ